MIGRCSICALLLLTGCAATDRQGLSEFGPTQMSKTSGGYALENRRTRWVIDENSGDLTAPLPISADVAGFGPAAPLGHVESRDTETWEYVGEDSRSGIGWRKVYCLEGRFLDVTYLITNLRAAPISTQIGLLSNSPARPDGPAREIECGGHVYHFQAFDESTNPPAISTGFLRSDIERLDPGQRMSWTMRWWEDD